MNSAKLQNLLAQRGIQCSVGSACNSGVPTPSHVLKAIGLTDEQVFNSIRFSISADNTEDDIKTICFWTKKFVEILRSNNENKE